MEEEKTLLRIDYVKQERLTNSATHFCRFMNDRVKPSLEALEMFDTDNALYYAEDSDRIYTDYKAKNLKGLEKVSLYLRRMAEEDITDRLYNTIGDGWEKQTFSADVTKVTEWKQTENGYEMQINDDALLECCKVYVNGKAEKTVYDKLQAICNELNSMTANKGLRGYETIIFCPIGGIWQINRNINLNTLI